ncbi:unnamed protein product [Rotaria sp. Silwood2]|nr:unnamed protein product [Rotaria sp. Silwood2]
MNSRNLLLIGTLLSVIVIIHSARGASIVCGFGYQPCGTRCYKPSIGEQCFNNGLICGFGYQPCGTRCYKPSIGEQCFNNGLVCGFGYQPCGIRCYKPSLGEQCYQ